MAVLPGTRRRRGMRPTCDRLESRELLSGTTQPIPDLVNPPLEIRAQQSGHQHHTANAPIVPRLDPQPDASFSTVPSNGDVNPYGVVIVPSGFPNGGRLHAGDVLVSNFNNSANVQGTGTTIVDISRGGSQSVFFQDSSVSGLTTTLGVLKRGFVVVGNTPGALDSNGNLVATGTGSLVILDRSGNKVATLSDPTLLNGPWGLTINDQGNRAQVFVSDVFSGTVTRVDLKLPRQGNKVVVQDMTQIASGYTHMYNSSVFFIGPTGLAYDPANKVLYVASTGDNAVFAIPNASQTGADEGMGRVVYQDQAHLRGPLGLALAPDGDLLTTNGDAINADSTQPSEIIEFSPAGTFVGQLSLNQAQGAAFGLAMTVSRRKLTLATVDDATNSLDERFVSV
jgi:DNA-binding beta-propeller fold protein YncE